MTFRWIAWSAVLLLGMLAQWFWSLYFSFWGLVPQILLVFTMAVAVRRGPLAGQGCGFLWGLFLDAMDVRLFGAHALGLTLVGYSIGILRRQMNVSQGVSQSVLVLFFSLAYVLFYGLAGLIFARQFLWVGWKVFFLGPLYNCLIAPCMFYLARRFLGEDEHSHPSK